MINSATPGRFGAGLCLVWGVAFAAFLAIGLRVSTGNVMITDTRLIGPIKDLPSWLAPWLELTARVGDPFPFALVVLGLTGLLFFRLQIADGIFLLSSAAPCVAQFFLKQLFQATPRSSAPPVGEWFHSYSYPSGHVVGIAVLCGLVWLLADRIAPWAPAAIALRIAALAFGASIGIARIWDNAHWPSDIVGGYLFALLFLIPAALAHRLVTNPAPPPQQRADLYTAMEVAD